MNSNGEGTECNMREMRCLKKPVPAYHSYLHSPNNPRNRMTGKKIVNLNVLCQGRDYAGRRTRTPGVIPVSEPWAFRDSDADQTGVLCCSGRAVFSSCYRPQIRVNINTTHVDSGARNRPDSRVRKAVPGNRSLFPCLKGSVVVSDVHSVTRLKHASFSAKVRSAEHVDRRLRKDHPEISARMRQGRGFGDLLKTQWSPVVCRSVECSY